MSTSSSSSSGTPSCGGPDNRKEKKETGLLASTLVDRLICSVPATIASAFSRWHQKPAPSDVPRGLKTSGSPGLQCHWYCWDSQSHGLSNYWVLSVLWCETIIVRLPRLYYISQSNKSPSNKYSFYQFYFSGEPWLTQPLRISSKHPPLNTTDCGRIYKTLKYKAWILCQIFWKLLQ